MTADSLTFYSFQPHLISWNVLYIGLYDRTTPIIIRLKAVQCRVTQSVRPQTAPVSPADFWQLSQLSCFLPGSVRERERERGRCSWLTYRPPQLLQLRWHSQCLLPGRIILSQSLGNINISTTTTNTLQLSPPQPSLHINLQRDRTLRGFSNQTVNIRISKHHTHPPTTPLLMT